MKIEDLKLIIENPELTKVLLNILANGDSTPNEMSGLEKLLFSESTNSLPKAPSVVDLRDKGHRAASQFVDSHSFKIGQELTIWYSGHESGLRGAFTSRGLNPSINTVIKGKKYILKIVGECAATTPAKKKSA
jgi:hypothetical protein